MQAGIEFGIGPHRLEFHRTDAVGVSGFLEVHRALDRRDAAGPLVRLADARPGDVENLLEALTARAPALNDLNAIQIAGRRDFHRPDNKRRSSSLRSRVLHGRQVLSHGDTVGIGGFHPVRALQNVRGVSPAAEEAHLNMRAANAEGFLAIHGVPEGSSSVLLGPYTGQPAGVFQAYIDGVAQHHSEHPPLEGSVKLDVPPIEIVLTVGTTGVVRVGTSSHAELVGVVAADVLHGDAVFQGLPRETAGDVINAAIFWRKAQEAAENFIVGDLVGWREQRMSLGRTFNLLDLDQALVAVA